MGEKERDDSKVIHVAFGPGGGRISTPPPPEATRGSAAVRREEAEAPFEPALQLFSGKDVERLLGLPSGKLRALDKAGIVQPSGARHGRRAYTFTDLIALRATSELLRARVTLPDVARAVGALRRTLPTVTRPLQELRITSDGRRIVVRADGATFEPVSGQMLLDFRVGHLHNEVVELLGPEIEGARARSAYDFYLQASTLDEDPATYERAEQLYRKAVDLDPHLAIAFTNLGNLRFRRGDQAGAEALYQKALGIDSVQPEAHYNLGYVMLERGEYVLAVRYFQHAIAQDPRFSDAYFNLAMALEAKGDRLEARNYWLQYLDLEPEGAWADIAREHL